MQDAAKIYLSAKAEQVEASLLEEAKVYLEYANASKAPGRISRLCQT